MYKSRNILYLLAFVLVCAMALPSCSPRKNTASSRKYQEFITRYNVYYNGDTHYKETLADMESKYEDDYSRRVFMHPVEAKNDPGSPQPSGDFNRSIEKAQKAIQLRSITKKPAKKAGKANDQAYKDWMKREEYNPFLHNAWLMMGRSQYYNGDFLGAASTFFYTSRHFWWLPKVVVEAKLMQALSYVSLGWLFEAEMILNRIKVDELTNNNLRRLYNYAYADYYIHADNYTEALPFLQEAVKGASGAQKTRLNFLLGQVYERLGDKAAAYKAFGAAGSASSASYRTKFNARIKQSEVFQGSDIEQEVKALRRMTRYDRNKDYQDQIYYAIGNLYLSRGDTAKAIENYQIANSKSTRNGIDKAMNQLKLGELFFLQGNYAKAQPAYAEAVPLLPASHPGYADIKRRSDVLDELAVYSQNVNLQDSLLELAAMTPEQQLEVVNKIIDELKKKEKEEAKQAEKEEYMAKQAASGDRLQDNNTQSFNINSDNSWYFYNNATKSAGKTDFQKRWGSRKLEDDWRRRNKSSFNTSDFDAPKDPDEQMAEEEDMPAEENEKQEENENANDPHFPEYYLAQIPKTEQEKATAHEVIQEGLYNMGVILKDKLEDFNAADAEFARLLKDYPDNIYRLDAYYNLYLMNMRRNNRDQADLYQKMIVDEFPDSKYGVAMRDPQYLEKLRNMDQRQQQLYDQAYSAYLDNDNGTVHRIYETINEEYPLSKTMPKFMFIDALAYVTERNPEKFNSVLRELLDRYPDTDLTAVTSAWLKGMAQGKELQAGVANTRAMIWETRLANDSIEGGPDTPAEFSLDDNSRQMLVFLFPTDQVSAPELIYQIARHNFQAFVVKDYDLDRMNFGRLGMITVKGFENKEELDHYRRVMANSTDFKLPAGVRPVAISEDNFQLLIDQGRSFDEYFHFLDNQNYVDAQAGLIPYEEIEELPQEVTEEQEQGRGLETRSPEVPKEKAKEPAKPAPAPMLPPGSEGDDDPLLD